MEILPSGKYTNRRNQTGLSTCRLVHATLQVLYSIIFFLPLCDTEKKLNRGQNFLLNVHDKFADQA